jgi:hypothetical protein
VAGKISISERALKRAMTLYESFRGRTPRRLNVVEIDIPEVTLVIGHLESVDYRTTHGERKKLTLYRHDFAPGSRPLLAVSPDGKQLFLLGGRYQFTERGIVDHDIEGREIDNPHHGRPLD